MFEIAIRDDLKISQDEMIFIAGPCAVESEEQLVETAKFLSRLGVKILRGGAYKPRTSPDNFQGLGEAGLKILASAADQTGMAIVTEVMDTENIGIVSRYSDILQVGSRNSQNFPLLKKLGRQKKPVLLKRGFGNTVDEFINSSRYISRGGNRNIIMVERGIRTFETSTRFTLDVSAVPVIKEMVDYPVLIDPSHPAGKRQLVQPLALAGIGSGSDGLMVEVHPSPESALSDREQQLDFQQFEKLYRTSQSMFSFMRGQTFLEMEKRER
ncbi:3-deoxy-7-phosphoheptulonate synthase [Oxyplasma meridianum]|uniref:3-deoxy-7-phosphoheptulonate synthase n=1 Tax=Oxyplasma meridianum TaxID=3073602 RepID=A0AAX4NE47_9ARCH